MRSASKLRTHFFSRWFRFEDRITPAIVTSFNPALSELTITCDAADTVALTSEFDGESLVYLNGAPALDQNGLTIYSRDVASVTVRGTGFGGNIFDMKGYKGINEKGIRRTVSMVLDGGGGNDTITACPYGSVLIGGDGVDELHGGDGPDWLKLDSSDVYCDADKDADVIELSVPATTTVLNISSDPDTGVSTVSWSAGQMLTILNSEIHTITIVGDAFSKVSATLTSPTGTSVSAFSGRSPNLGSNGQDGVSIEFEGHGTSITAARKGNWDVVPMKKCVAVDLIGGPGDDTFTIQPGAAQVSVSGGAGIDQVVVNNYGYPSQVTTAGVQVQGMAPVLCSNDCDDVKSSRVLYDGDAIADLQTKGVTFSTTSVANTDGSVSNTVTLTNAGSAIISDPVIRPRHLKKRVGYRVAVPGPGGGPPITFATGSLGTSVSVLEDPDAPSSLEMLLVNGQSSVGEVVFTGPSSLPGGSSMSASFRTRYKGWDGTIKGTLRIVSPTTGTTDYDINLSDFFQFVEPPQAVTTNSVVSATTGQPPTGGASNVAAVDATGATVVVTSSASGIDSSITALTPGQHVYVGGRLLDRPPGSSSSGNGASGKASVSADGRFVVFQTSASNLDPSVIDVNGQSDICVCDLVTGEVRVLSRSSLETGNGKSFEPRISSNGEYVTFLSLATNLIPGVIDNNGEADLFSYDLHTQTLECVSVIPAGGQTCNKGVLAHDLDASGEIVCWLSEATDMASAPSPVGLHLGRYSTTLSSVVTITDPSFNAAVHSYGLAQSGDGSSVYVWTSCPLLPSVAGVPDSNGQNDIVRVTIATGVTTLVSVNSAGTSTADAACPASGERCAVSFSGDACAFTSSADNLIPNLPAPATQGLYLYRASGFGGGPLVKRLDQFSSGQYGGDNHTPSMSADGLTVACVSTSDYTSPTPASTAFAQIFVCDTSNSRLQRASSSISGGPGGGHSTIPIVCNSGQCVSFSSSANDLVAGDLNGQVDAITTVSHHQWGIELSNFSINFTKIEMKYQSADDRYLLVDIPTGTVLASRAAADTNGITIRGRDGVDEQFTLNLDSGLTKLSGNVSVFTGQGNDSITVNALLMPALMKAKEKANRTKCSASLRFTTPSSDGFGEDTLFECLAQGDHVTWMVNAPSTTSVEFTSQLDVGSSAGAQLAVTNSGADLVISNGDTTFVHNDSFKVTPVSIEDKYVFVLTAQFDSCVVSLNGLPPGQPTIRVFGGSGNDTITAATTTACGVTIDGGDGDDVCTGGSKDDILVISPGIDVLDGGGGNSSWTKGGGASVGKPNPGRISTAFDSFDCTIIASPGSNTLDFSYGPPVSIDLSSSASQQICPTGKIRYTGPLPNFVGSEFSDTVHLLMPTNVPVLSGDFEIAASSGDVLVVDAQGKAVGDVGGRLVSSSGGAVVHSGFEQVVVTNNAPTLQVASVIIDDGSVQRSMVRSVNIVFSGDADFGGLPPESAFKLAKGSSTIPLAASVSKNSGFTSVVLTFPGSTEAGSLSDGRYTLTIQSSFVFNATMGLLDGNADGTPGGDYVLDSTGALGIFRQFGDVNGDSYTDNVDFIEYRAANGSDSTMMNFDPAFDSNGDGFIDNVDFIAFRQRIGQSP